MKNLIRKISVVLLLFIVSSFGLMLANWNIDKDYSIKFSGRMAEGTFSGLSGKIVFSQDDLEHSFMDVAVDANTIKTGNDTKDKHAKDDSWFDTEKYPKIKFTSSGFKKIGSEYMVTGALTLHGVTKEMQIPFRFTDDGNKGLFTGEFKLERKDYGIKGNAMGFTVGKEFAVTLRVPVDKR